MRKPPITANQVTLLRLLLLPIGGVLMYSGIQGQWAALVFMTLLGCTDFVDGWLARRYGSTELGRLMDPLADKVFVVTIFMPFIDLGWLPALPIGLLLSREFIVTALRSTYERRKIPPRTAFLAKVKAWAQMAGCGVLFMLRVVPRPTMIILIVVGAVAPVVFTLIRYLATGYIWRVSFIFAGWFLALLLPYIYLGTDVTVNFLAITVIVITWVSAWGYIAPVLRMVASGQFDPGDWVRLVGSITLPVVLILAQAGDDLTPWVIIVTMCLEMAVGGLDNLLCAHNAETRPALWGLRVGLVTCLTAAAMYLKPIGPWLMLAACGVSLFGNAITFYRGRRYYLQEPEGRERSRTTGDD